MVIGWFFCASVECLSNSITSENAEAILNQSHSFPLFVYVWDAWCPHCAKFSPIWKQLSDVPDYQNRLFFGDLDCSVERKLCRALSPGRTFPRLIWLDSPTAPVQHYSGVLDAMHIVKFIRAQFGTSLQVVKSAAQMDELISERGRKSLFIFNVSTSDNDTVSLVSKVAFRLRHFPVNYALLLDSSSHLPVVLHVTADGRTIQFSEILEAGSLVSFVKHYSVPFLAPWPGEIVRHAELEGIAVCIFVFRPADNETYGRVIKIARTVHELAPVAHASCEFTPDFCRYVGLRREVGVVFLNKSANAFWVSELNADQAEWVSAILRRELKGRGPGEGFLAEFWAFFYEMRGRGGVRYWILYLPVLLFVVYFPTVIIRCMTWNRSQRKLRTD
jgi:hypothetical protein